jgi:1-deoxy-D-xylulose-5-phosphate reductoisomerase
MDIALLGSTGSIGTQTLEIARAYPQIRIRGMSAYSNIVCLEKQIREFHPKLVCVVKEDAAKELKIRIADLDTRVVSGEDGLCQIASMKEADMVLTAVVGISGLRPTIAAIKAGKNIALANKETLVTAGQLVMSLAQQYGIKILPVDSEHSAIFQSLQGQEKKIKKILLTASGGPFFGMKKQQLETITPKDALKNPNWDMGAKVTVDSSTLVNKGLEVIEAKWLFGVEFSQIEVLVHRQSIVHSMVQYEDNAVIAQLGTPDMRLPIQYALTYPNRLPMERNEIDFTKEPLTFEKPDTDTFYALSLAYRAGEEGGTMPCIFNSADEAAVELFLKHKISFLQIPQMIEEAMRRVKSIENPSIEDIFETDQAVRDLIRQLGDE